MQFKNKLIWASLLLILCISAAEALEYNISVPQETTVGKWFAVNISVHTNETITLEAYSYVYKGFNCTGQGWIANKKEVSLAAGETKTFTLEDLIKFGTEEGMYNLRVKLNHENSNITETYSLKVLEGESEMQFKEIYLYLGLIAVCIIGVFLAFRLNK